MTKEIIIFFVLSTFFLPTAHPKIQNKFQKIKIQKPNFAFQKLGKMPISVLTYPCPLPHWVDVRATEVAIEHAERLLKERTALGALGDMRITLRNVDIAQIPDSPIEPLVIIFTREDTVYHKALGLLRNKRINKLRISDMGRSIDSPLLPSTLEAKPAGYFNSSKSTHIPAYFKRLAHRTATPPTTARIEEAPRDQPKPAVRMYSNVLPPLPPFRQDTPRASVKSHPPPWVIRFKK